MRSGPENEREREDADLSALRHPREPQIELIRLSKVARAQLADLLDHTSTFLDDESQAGPVLLLWPREKYERSFDQFRAELDGQLSASRVARELIELAAEVPEFFGLALMTSLSKSLKRFYNQHLLGPSAVFTDKAKDLFHELRMTLEYFKFCRNLGPELERLKCQDGFARLGSKSAFSLRDALNVAAPELDESWHRPRAGDHEFKLPEIAEWERAHDEEGNTLLQQTLIHLNHRRLPEAYFHLVSDDTVALDVAFVAVFKGTLKTIQSLGDDLHLSHLKGLPRRVEVRFDKLLDDAEDLLDLFHFAYFELGGYL